VFAVLLLLFIIVPLVELSLLLVLGSCTYWWVPLVLVILTGAVGAWLARLQGWHTYRRIQQELAQGRLPTDSLLDALMIFVAGALLLTPGMLTDAFGFSLLIPPCRRVYKGRIVRWLKSRFQVEAFSTRHPHPTVARDQIIDSYVVDRPTDEPSQGKPDRS